MARFILSLGLTFALLGGVASAGPMRSDAVGVCAVATTLPEPPKNRPHYAMEIRVEPGAASLGTAVRRAGTKPPRWETGRRPAIA